MGLPRPLNELIEIARRDDWHKILVGSDLRQILGEVKRLQVIDREQLKGKAKAWKKRLSHLDMMAAEMLATPGAEALLAKAKAANNAINELDSALDLAVSGRVKSVAEINTMCCRARAKTLEEAKAKVLEGLEPVEEINTPVLHRPGVWITPRTLCRELYKVPTRAGGVERLGTVAANGDRWDWCRHNSEVYDWDGERGGTVGTLEQAKAKVLEGWDST